MLLSVGSRANGFYPWAVLANTIDTPAIQFNNALVAATYIEKCR